MMVQNKQSTRSGARDRISPGKEGSRVFVTGAGGIAGVNFVRALKASPMGYWVGGSDYNTYYIELPELD